jgi:nitrate reductase gamma subunit
LKKLEVLYVLKMATPFDALSWPALRSMFSDVQGVILFKSSQLGPSVIWRRNILNLKERLFISPKDLLFFLMILIMVIAGVAGIVLLFSWMFEAPPDWVIENFRRTQRILRPFK